MPEQSSSGAEGAGGGGGDDGGVVADLLEHTMFNRQLTVTNEDMVAALVAQIFEGIRCGEALGTAVPGPSSVHLDAACLLDLAMGGLLDPGQVQQEHAWPLLCNTHALNARLLRRDHVVQSMELKFNCFFLMPVVDAFPSRLRSQMEALYEAVGSLTLAQLCLQIYSQQVLLAAQPCAL